MDIMDSMDIMDIMDSMDIMDIMDIMIITAWLAMAGAVLALVLWRIEAIHFGKPKIKNKNLVRLIWIRGVNLCLILNTAHFTLYTTYCTWSCTCTWICTFTLHTPHWALHSAHDTFILNISQLSSNSSWWQVQSTTSCELNPDWSQYVNLAQWDSLNNWDQNSFLINSPCINSPKLEPWTWLTNSPQGPKYPLREDPKKRGKKGEKTYPNCNKPKLAALKNL